MTAPQPVQQSGTQRSLLQSQTAATAQEEDERRGRENWLKVHLSLYYTKLGLHGLCDTQAGVFHQRLLSTPGLGARQCTTCGPQDFQKTKTKNRLEWTITCPGGICDKWLTELLKNHLHTQPQISWSNTNPQAWATEPWELAKVYQAKGCENHKSAADSDSSSLLALLSNCLHFRTLLGNDAAVEAVREVRNTIMHGSTCYVTEKDRNNYIDKMVNLLKAARGITTISDAEKAGVEEAVDKIDKLRNNVVEIVLDRQLESLALREQMAQTKKDVDDIQRKLDICRQDLDTLKTGTASDINEIKNDKDELRTLVNQCSIRIDSIASFNHPTQDAFDTLEKSVHSLQEGINDLSHKFDEEFVQRKAACPSAILSPGTGDPCEFPANKEATMNPNSRGCDTQVSVLVDGLPEEFKELQDNLRDLYTTYCQRIPISPNMPHKKYHLDKLYVKPTMIRVPLDDRTANKMKQSSSVNSYNDIFSVEGTPVQNIYISGDAGIGKSTFCEHIVNLWCQSKNPDNARQGTVEDQNILSKFTLLFYISLRESAAQVSIDNDNIVDMIKIQLGVDKSELVIKRILEKERCLVVLDGLDEWAPKGKETYTRFECNVIPKRPLLGKFTVLTTSRPWKLETLRAQLEGKIDNHVSIVGLGQKAVHDLVNNIIEILNEGSDMNKSANDFFREVRQTDIDLKKIVAIPVLLQQLVCLWYKGRALDASLVELYSDMVVSQLHMAETKPLLPASQSSISKLEVAMPEQNVQAPQLPQCLQNKTICRGYAKLLMSLANLAHAAFLSKCRETSLVFDHQDTEIHGMSDEDVEICLRIGLLTQNAVLGKVLEEKKRISFMHKTFQEYFAALHVATHFADVGVEGLFPEWSCSVERILEMEKVFVFVCGMNSQAGQTVMTYIAQQMSNTPQLKSFGSSIDKEYGFVIEVVLRFQYVLLDCLQEATRNKHAICIPLNYLVCSDYDVNVVSRLQRHKEGLDTKHMKGIYMVTPSGADEAVQDDIREMFGCIMNSDSVERIYLFDWGSCIGVDTLFDAMYHSKQTLKAVAFLNIQIAFLGPQFVKVMHSLENLEALGLEGYTLDWGVVLTHDQLIGISDVLLNIPKLERLRFEEISCAEHTDCQYSLKLPTLQELYMDNLNVTSIEIDASRLTKCELRHLMVPGVARTLFIALKSAIHLSTLMVEGFLHLDDLRVLWDILPHLHTLTTFSFGVPRFKEVVGKQLKLAIPSSLKNLKQVHTDGMQLTNSCLRDFVDNLPSKKVEVWLEDINLENDGDMIENTLDYIKQSGKFVLLQETGRGGKGWFRFKPKE